MLDLDILVRALSQVRGVNAVALGGSQSRGEAAVNSDYDIGVYYLAGALDEIGLSNCLQELDDNHGEKLLNPPGEWGPWINGGAWLTVGGAPVDILLRETGRVEAVLGDCLAGRITVDYQCGHPFGFTNTIYAAEIHYCKPLWQDSSAPVGRLKGMLAADGGYPAAMREAVIRKFLWEAWFALSCARKPAVGGEINYAMGSVFRAVCAWTEVLYALNSRYLMNEKGALRKVEGLALRPEGMEKRVLEAYGLLAAGRAGGAYAILDGLHAEIETLAAGIPQADAHIR